MERDIVGKKRLVTEDAREYLKKGDILLALVRTATDLESLIAWKLICEKKKMPDSMRRKTLGQLITMADDEKLFKDTELSLINKFKDFRNSVAHERIFIDKIVNNDESKAEVKKLIESILDLINKTYIICDKEGDNLLFEYFNKRQK